MRVSSLVDVFVAVAEFANKNIRSDIPAAGSTEIVKALWLRQPTVFDFKKEI